MTHWYVTAEHKNPLFQYDIEADTAEEAIALAMARPNSWTRDSLRGVQWDISARELPKTGGIGQADVVKPEAKKAVDADTSPHNSLAQDLYNKYQRVSVQAYGGGEVCHWEGESSTIRRIWRSMAAFVMSRGEEGNDT